MVYRYKIGDIIIGEYKVLDIFGGEGKSGMGICYLVESRDFENPLILKTYQKSSINSINRFKSEAETWLSLGIHPNIVKCLFVNEINDQLFIGAEYIQSDEYGRNSVLDYLRTSKVSIYYIIKWIAQYCYAMNYAISKGLKVHRDIKPDNLMIDNMDNLKVTDFGIAKINFEQTRQQVKSIENAIAGLTEDGVFLGTLLYSSPEQIMDSSSIDFHSDMYSFGIVIYEMISGGKFPYSLKNKTTYEDYLEMHFNDPLVEIAHPLFPIVFKCMQRRPENRFSNYNEMLESLRKICTQLNIDILQEAVMHDKILEELYTKSFSYITLGDLEKANNSINQYLEIEKGNSSAWGLKGRIEMHLGNFENALQPTLKSYDIDPYNTHTLNNLGLIYKNIGNLVKGIYYFIKAVEMDPFNSGALMNLAIALGKNADYPEAADCILRALELAPDKKTLLFNAGNIAAMVMKNGLPDKAIPIFEKLVILDKNEPNHWFSLSLLYEYFKRYNDAITCLKNVVKLKPDDEEASLRLSNITKLLKDKGQSI